MVRMFWRNLVACLGLALRDRAEWPERGRADITLARIAFRAFDDSAGETPVSFDLRPDDLPGKAMGEGCCVEELCDWQGIVEYLSEKGGVVERTYNKAKIGATRFRVRTALVQEDRIRFEFEPAGVVGRFSAGAYLCEHTVGPGDDPLIVRPAEAWHAAASCIADRLVRSRTRWRRVNGTAYDDLMHSGAQNYPSFEQLREAVRCNAQLARGSDRIFAFLHGQPGFLGSIILRCSGDKPELFCGRQSRLAWRVYRGLLRVRGWRPTGRP
jgi:hypothetical protein